jgi:SAM-dependent methyltransferase
LTSHLGPESFDLVLCTEVMEHVRNWRTAVSNLKGVLKRGGTLLLTTRSRPFRYHGYPYDFWRYEISDMATVFADFKIDVLEPDPSAYPGVLLKARKPLVFAERDLRDVSLYSVVRRRRCRDWRRTDVLFLAPFALKARLSPFVPGSVKNLIRRVYSAAHAARHCGDR